MKRYLNGFANHQPFARGIWDLGFAAVRVDTKEQAAAALRQGYDVLWIVRFLYDIEQAAALREAFPYRDIQIEWHNEPDLNKVDPTTYGLSLRLADTYARTFGLTLWGGVISNLNDRGFTYLKAIEQYLPQHVSVHWYPHRPWLPNVGHDGRSRALEIATLRGIIGPYRSWGVSEFGYHTAPVSRPEWYLRWRKKAISNEEAARHIRAEWAYWEQAGAQFATLYQMMDGPTNTQEDRFGIYDAKWNLKPQAHTL